MKAVTPIPFVRAKFTDKCGKPLVGGKIYTYESNTTTPKNTYKDPYGMAPNTNPIILDTAGEADIYLHGTYRIIVKDRRDAVINDVSKLGSWFSATLDDTLNDISMAFNDTIQPIIDDAEKSFIAIEQNLNNEKNEILQSLQDAIDQALAAGAGANGWTDSLISTGILDAVTQHELNRKTVTTVPELSALTELITWQNRNVYVRGDGQYYYKDNVWNKDQTLNIYQFKTEQYIAYYYKQLGSWSKAIFEAQCNIYRKGLSTILRLPAGNILLNEPIYGGQGLIEYMAIHAPDIDTIGQWIPLTIVGAPRSTEGRPEDFLGTQLVFDAIKSSTDMTWSNYGIIHSAPLDYKKMESDDMKNAGSVILKDVNIRPDNINLGESSVHGIVIRNSSKNYFQNVTIYGCYGSGFYGSWIFDSQFDQLTVIRCGRMSPDGTKFMSDGNLDAQYQTYAPVHITQPDTHVGDNSNFLYFHKLHLEDNTYANGDIIINGDSSPIVFYDSHHETDGNGVGSKALKTCVLLGGYGVKYFGQDQESGFDYTNFAKTNRAGYATLVNAGVYADGYAYLSKQKEWSTVTYNTCNTELPVYVYSYNSGGGVTLNDTSIGDFIHEGFTDRGHVLKATQATVGNIYLGKGNGSGGNVSLVNCDCGDMSIGSDSKGDWAKSMEIRATNTSFTSISGSYPNFFGDIKLTSATQASTFNVLYKADLDIRSYNFLETTGV